MKESFQRVRLIFSISVAYLSAFFFGYYIAVIAGAIPIIDHQLHFSSVQDASFTSLLFLGAGIGGLCSGFLAKKLGRKKVFWLTGFLLILGNVLLLSPEYGMLLFARGLQGFSVGIISVVTPLYLSEISSPNIRGKVVAGYQFILSVGILVAYFVNTILASSGNWQEMFWLGLIFVVIQMVLLFLIPESPYWYLAKNKTKEAFAIFDKLGIPHVSEVQSSADNAKDDSKKNPRIVLFIILIGLAISLFQQLSGINITVCYAPVLFQQAGFSSLSAALISTIVLGIVGVLVGLVAIWFPDLVGRRKVLIWSFLGMGICLLGCTYSLYFHPSFGNTLTLTSLIVYRVFYALGAGPIIWLVLAEMFPLHVREKSMGLALFVNWMGGFGVLQTLPYLFDKVHVVGVFFIYAVFNFIALGFIIRYLPETKQKPLEEIFGLFKKILS